MPYFPQHKGIQTTRSWREFLYGYNYISFRQIMQINSKLVNNKFHVNSSK